MAVLKPGPVLLLALVAVAAFANFDPKSGKRRKVVWSGMVTDGTVVSDVRVVRTEDRMYEAQILDGDEWWVVPTVGGGEVSPSIDDARSVFVDQGWLEVTP